MSLARLLSDLIPGKGVARRLAVLTLAQSAGNGLFLTSNAVFFVQVVGLSPGEVATGLSIGGLAGLLATTPVGILADRVGVPRLLAFDHAALVLLFMVYPFVHGFIPFVVVAGLVSAGEICGGPLRSALIRSAFAPAEAVRTRAQLRSAYNVGFMLGAAGAGLALAAPDVTAFGAVCLANVLAQALCAVVVISLRKHRPHAPEPPRGARRIGSALRDGRFMLITLGNGLLELHTTVVVVGLPLWIVTRTRAPASLNAALIILNTAIVLLFQVRLSRGSETANGSAALQRRAGLVLAVACAICASSEGAGLVVATVVLLLGTAVLSVGEAMQAAGAWGLSFELPPPGRQGEYQGAFALGRGIQQFAGPAVVVPLVLGAGAIGWLLIGAMFVVVGLSCLRLVTGAWRPARGRHRSPAGRTGTVTRPHQPVRHRAAHYEGAGR